MRIDLHNHTNHSDGVLTPKELLDRAIKNNVDIFALTDHDSVFGCDEIYELAKDTNVKVIKGMELSTTYKGESVHIICLFKGNVVPDIIRDFSVDMLNKRKERAIKMIEKIRDIYNVNVDVKELLEDGEIITRANMYRHILKHNNISESDASFMVSTESKGYIQSTKLSVEDGLTLAKSGGCITIFAHPCLVKEAYIEEILAYGFDGIEARYPSKKNDELKYRELAKKYNLFISAGSDCHGDKTHADIGTCTLDEYEFEIIKNKLQIKELI